MAPSSILLEPTLAGPTHRVPTGRGETVPAPFWIAAALLTFAVAIGLPLSGTVATLAATIVFVGGGLPHGAYDIALLAQTRMLDGRGMALVLGGYILVAVSMVVLWLAAPVVALIAFLAAAAVHFGEDWTMLDEPLLKVAAGAAIIAAPALAHPAAVTALFVAMSEDRAGVVIAQVMVAAAPVALLVTTVGVAVAWREGARAWATATTVALLALLIAPPVLGFALFFVFLHSPRHFASTRGTLRMMSRRRWLLTGASMSTAAIAGWLVLTRLVWSLPTPDLTAQAFQLLAAVAVPHLLLSRSITNLLARRSAAASLDYGTTE
jgi:Brp/Blh family beta-carotene 15,15'-monooxygenase